MGKLLYLREAKPFLPADPFQKMNDTIKSTKTKGATQSHTMDSRTQKRLANRSTALVISDCVIIVLEMFQILALIQSMSLKWSYPPSWLKYTNFLFIFNADAWEFIKVHSKAYTRVQGMETPSSEIPVDYDHILLAWAGFLFILGSIFISVFLILRHKQPPYLMVHYARLERVFFFCCQILALPLGTALFRLFHCPDDKMATNYSVKCLEGVYWAYFVSALVGIVFMFVVVPIWMAVKIRKQKLTATSYHHEDYMKLKEVEYMAGLDVVWVVQGYHLFSSFRLRAVYYRPIVFVVKLVLLIIFATADDYIHNQAVVTSVVLSILALLVILIRPFRVLSFNVALSVCLGCLAGDAVFGALIASVTPATVESAWLVEPYSYWMLTGINTILVLCLVSWIIFMVSVKYCCRKWFFPNDPVWPVMTSYEYEVNEMETYKFMAAVLRGRAILDSCIRAPSVFAPVHQLARQIEIINAFCREAEKTKDGVHATLLQLLDDMIDVYRRLEPVSLFSETVKENIRQNASRFVEIMPQFCQRLAQRDYDFILVHPAKKRLLLKMYIVGMFINSKKQQPVKDPLTQKSLHQIWNELPEVMETRDEVEYRQDLYPEPPMGPDMETLYMAGTIDKPLELMDLDDSDEEESLAAFLGRVPPVLTMKDEESRRGSRASLILKDIETTPEEENRQPTDGPSEGTSATNLMDEPVPGVNTITVVEAEIENTSNHESGTGSPIPNIPDENTEENSTVPIDTRGSDSPILDENKRVNSPVPSENTGVNSPVPNAETATDEPEAGFVNPAFVQDNTEIASGQGEVTLVDVDGSPMEDVKSEV